MDEDYEIDDFNDDSDDFDSDDDTLDDEDDTLSDDEIELAGSLDGEFDAGHNLSMYGGYGSSIDLDSLTDEQKDLYDDAYHASYDNNKDE
ncbi:hypothetical protein IKE83_00690 [Candidatus Saccharibacteria bacterium]|nr:hypothetical protein [Candidatus Saccharibacteria bacterium]